MGVYHRTFLSLLSFSLWSGVACSNFTCLRPTTQCDFDGGFCQPNGMCSCFNGATGLRCQIAPSAKRNAGNCVIFNPCSPSGTCYDDGVVAKCDCMDGYYGEKCQHPMVYWECNKNEMPMNVFPHGFDVTGWTLPPPVTGQGLSCSLDTMSTFLTKYPYYNRGWMGFAAILKHADDPCAGNATIVLETASKVTYTRTVFISYSTSGRDPTDQTLDLTCDVSKLPPPTTPAPVLAPPAINISFFTPLGQELSGPMKLGSNVHVHFKLNIPNSGGFDDAQVESCLLVGPNPAQKYVVVDKACAQPPVGQLLYKQAPGVAVLIMSLHKFSATSNNITFQCRVRACNKAKDKYCSTPANCFLRIKRSLRDNSLTSNEDDVFVVESKIIV